MSEANEVDGVVIRKKNRYDSMKSKLGLFWCGSCDRQLVGQVGKCPVCGNRQHPKKRKGV